MVAVVMFSALIDEMDDVCVVGSCVVAVVGGMRVVGV